MIRFNFPFSAGCVAVCVLSGAWAANVAAQAKTRYVKDKQGQRPQPIVAIDKVCCWPNLTLLRDGTILAVGFNQPGHGQLVGDTDCWASTDGDDNDCSTPLQHND